MHTDLRNAQLTVPGRRELSATAKFWHWTAMLCTGFLWTPVYLIAKHRTRNVRY